MTDPLESELHDVLVRRVSGLSPKLDGATIRAMTDRRRHGPRYRTDRAGAVLFRPLIAAAVIVAVLVAISIALITGPRHRHTPAVGPRPPAPTTVRHRPSTAPVPTNTPTIAVTTAMRT